MAEHETWNIPEQRESLREGVPISKQSEIQQRVCVTLEQIENFPHYFEFQEFSKSVEPC